MQDVRVRTRRMDAGTQVALLARAHGGVLLRLLVVVAEDVEEAVDHEVEGPHAAIGAQIAQKHNLPFKVVNGIAAHHQEVEYACIEAAAYLGAFWPRVLKFSGVLRISRAIWRIRSKGSSLRNITEASMAAPPVRSMMSKPASSIVRAIGSISAVVMRVAHRHCWASRKGPRARPAGV